jgi:hypothetical protein
VTLLRSVSVNLAELRRAQTRVGKGDLIWECEMRPAVAGCVTAAAGHGRAYARNLRKEKDEKEDRLLEIVEWMASACFRGCATSILRGTQYGLTSEAEMDLTNDISDSKFG